MEKFALELALRTHLALKGLSVEKVEYTGSLPRPGTCRMSVEALSSFVKKDSFQEYLETIKINDAFCNVSSMEYLKNKRWRLSITFDFSKLVR